MEELVDSILDYVRADYTDYAIMINGEWGSGKTYFWNNKVRSKIESTDINKEIVFEQENGENKPITEKIVMPKIEGAIITAKGAGDMTIKTNIIQAVEAVTGLATHKIQVFVMN